MIRHPVILLHGTNDTSLTMHPLAARMHASAALDPRVIDYGRHPTSLRGRLGRGGIGALADSFEEILVSVDRVLRHAEADRFDVVGHSQGGLHALALAGARPEQVGQVILLGSPVTGVVPIGPATHLLHRRPLRVVLDALLGPSARAQVRGSASLPGADVFVPGVHYLLVTSDHDRTIRTQHIPPTFADRLRILRVQDLGVPGRVSHIDLVRHPMVLDLVVKELGRRPPPAG